MWWYAMNCHGYWLWPKIVAQEENVAAVMASITEDKANVELLRCINSCVLINFWLIIVDVISKNIHNYIAVQSNNSIICRLLGKLLQGMGKVLYYHNRKQYGGPLENQVLAIA